MNEPTDIASMEQRAAEIDALLAYPTACFEVQESRRAELALLRASIERLRAAPTPPT